MSPTLFSQLVWRKVETELPDAEITVLCHTEDGDVWPGFLDGDVWRTAGADRFDSAVTHWMPFPPPPED